MKKLLVLVITVLAFNLSNAQTYDFGLGYFIARDAVEDIDPQWSNSTENDCLVFIMDVKLSNKLIIGGFIGFSIKGGGVGKNYTPTLSPNRYTEDIYEYSYSNTIFGGRIGREIFKNIELIGSLGLIMTDTWGNRYDSYEILSPNGYYTVQQDSTGDLYVNIEVKGRISRNISLSGGIGRHKLTFALFYTI